MALEVKLNTHGDIAYLKDDYTLVPTAPHHNKVLAVLAGYVNLCKLPLFALPDVDKVEHMDINDWDIRMREGVIGSNPKVYVGNPQPLWTGVLEDKLNVVQMQPIEQRVFVVEPHDVQPMIDGTLKVLEPTALYEETLHYLHNLNGLISSSRNP